MDELTKRDLCLWARTQRILHHDTARYIAGLYGCSIQNVISFENGTFNSRLWLFYLNKYKPEYSVLFRKGIIKNED